MIRSVIASLLFAAAAPAAAQTIAITGGMVALGDGSEPIPGGTVVVRNGRIVAAGENVRIPAGAEIIDARGKWVTPGIVAGFSRIGLTEIDLGGDGTTDDKADGGPFGAAIDVAPAVNPTSSTIAVNRADGVTRAVVAPNAAKSIFAGQGAVIDLGADMEPITRARLFQFVEFGETGADTAGGSRASAFVLFRNALKEASELRRYSPADFVGTPGPRGIRPPDRPQPQRIPRIWARRPPERGRPAHAVRRRGARSGASGPPVSADPRRARSRHPQRHRPQARLSVAEARPRRSNRRLAGRRPASQPRESRSSPRRSTICPPASSSSRRPSRTSGGCGMPASTSRSA